MKMEKNKPHSVHLRLNDEQYKFLQDMADGAGIGVSDALRMMVNTMMTATRKINAATVQIKKSLGDLEDDNNARFVEHQL